MLDKFVKAKQTQEGFRIKRFDELIVGKSKTEIREIEMKLLVPRPIPKYTGPAPRDVDFKLRAIKFVFRNRDEVELIKRHVKVSHYVENNSQDVAVIVAIFKAIDEGRIKFDGKDFSFVLIGEEKKERVIKRRKKKRKIKRRK